MPKRPEGVPQDLLRETFARRLDEEATRRGWSDATVAHRTRTHRADCVDGCHHYPISPTTVWKLKHADPPRRIDIDEAAAVAVGCFGYASVDAFLADSPVRPLREAVTQADGAILAAAAAITQAEKQLAALDELLAESDWLARARIAARPVEMAETAAELEAWAGWVADGLGDRLARIADRLRLAADRVREVAEDV